MEDYRPLTLTEYKSWVEPYLQDIENIRKSIIPLPSIVNTEMLCNLRQKINEYFHNLRRVGIIPYDIMVSCSYDPEVPRCDVYYGTNSDKVVDSDNRHRIGLDRDVRINRLYMEYNYKENLGIELDKGRELTAGEYQAWVVPHEEHIKEMWEAADIEAKAQMSHCSSRQGFLGFLGSELELSTELKIRVLNVFFQQLFSENKIPYKIYAISFVNDYSFSSSIKYCTTCPEVIIEIPKQEVEETVKALKDYTNEELLAELERRLNHD